MAPRHAKKRAFMNTAGYPAAHHVPIRAHMTPQHALFAGEPQAIDADIVIPVYNEEIELGSSIVLLVDYLKTLESMPNPINAQVVIADNASSDKTWSLACSLAETFPGYVRAIRIPEKGRGRALKTAWLSSQARALAYMDVDLSTDILQIPELLRPILEGAADVSFGSRLMAKSDVQRCPKREFISRTYNRMLQKYLGVTFRDAQCGFKAISAEAARALLPQVEDNEWFFDTELLVLAERMGVATNEFPVRWKEDSNSTVHIADTVRKDLAGMRRLKASAAGAANTVNSPSETAPSTANDPAFCNPLHRINENNEGAARCTPSQNKAVKSR